MSNHEKISLTFVKAQIHFPKLHDIRCPKCWRKIGEVNGHYAIACKQCKIIVAGITRR